MASGFYLGPPRAAFCRSRPRGALRAPDIILRPFGYRLTPSSPPPPRGRGTVANPREANRREGNHREGNRREGNRGKWCLWQAAAVRALRPQARATIFALPPARRYVVYIWCPPEGGNMRNGAAAEGRRMRKWRPLRRSVSGSCALTCALLVFPGSSAGARRRSQRSNSRCSEVARGSRSRRRQGCRGAVARELR